MTREPTVEIDPEGRGALLATVTGLSKRSQSANSAGTAGSAVTLAEILDRVPSGENMHWSMIDFHGVGLAPGELTMDDFEEKLRRSPSGVAFSWQELRVFAGGLQQTIDCEIVGEGSSPSNSRNLVLRMLDSTRWEISSSDRSLIEGVSGLS